MDINYVVAALVLIAIVALVVYLIRRNNKDRKKMLRNMAKSEFKPDKHSDEEI